MDIKELVEAIIDSNLSEGAKEEIVEIVEAWNSEHPVDEDLKRWIVYPKAVGVMAKDWADAVYRAFPEFVKKVVLGDEQFLVEDAEVF
jgi:hypothetical protein